jgi:hypothetical protein
MRPLIFLLIPLMFSCKSNKLIDNKSLTDYQYPLDSLITPKVFIYQRADSAEKLSYHYQQLIVKNNQKILIRSTLGDGNMRDSSVYDLINNKLVLQETYMIMKDRKTNKIKPSKGEVLEDIDNGVNNESKFKFTNPFAETIISTVKLKSTYDTIIVYRLFGKDLDCIRYKNNMTVSIKHKYIPFIGKSLEKIGESIFAKGLGLVYYSMTDVKDKSTFSWKLKEIIDYKK